MIKINALRILVQYENIPQFLIVLALLLNAMFLMDFPLFSTYSYFSNPILFWFSHFSPPQTPFLLLSLTVSLKVGELTIASIASSRRQYVPLCSDFMDVGYSREEYNYNQMSM